MADPSTCFEVLQRFVNDIYEQFLGDVSSSRAVDKEELRKIADGRILTGILRGDDGKALTLVDSEARTVMIPHQEVEERRPSDVSLMPSGLAEGLSREDFADLIGYLGSLRAGGG